MIVAATVVASIAISMDLQNELSVSEVRDRVLEQAHWLMENNGLCFEIVELDIQDVVDATENERMRIPCHIRGITRSPAR